ncbi:hypothetical protein ACIOZL_29930 [Streptomyces sp. NPDC087769]|uniref:hypothetical protein n=1 Tax=Streptomyces sp. NPDC087769 TaxID=3365802 RepID=UPI0037F9C059
MTQHAPKMVGPRPLEHLVVNKRRAREAMLLAHEPTAGDIIAKERAHILTAWLPDDLQQAAHALLTKGQRLAQEATNRNELSVEPDWRW